MGQVHKKNAPSLGLESGLPAARCEDKTSFSSLAEPGQAYK
jgi:hypothetical protein